MTNKLSGIFFVSGSHDMTRLVKCNDLQKRMSEWEAASQSPPFVTGSITTAEARSKVAQWLRDSGHAGVGTDQSEDAIFADLKRVFESNHVRGQWYRLSDAILSQMPRELQVLLYSVKKLRAIWKANGFELAKIKDGERTQLVLLYPKHSNVRQRECT